MQAAVHQKTNDTEFSLELSAEEVRGEVALCDLTSMRTPDKRRRWRRIVINCSIFNEDAAAAAASLRRLLLELGFGQIFSVQRVGVELTVS